MKKERHGYHKRDDKVKAITSIMIKVSDYNLWFVYMLMDAYRCVLMIITLFLCFLTFEKVDRHKTCQRAAWG